MKFIKINRSDYINPLNIVEFYIKDAYEQDGTKEIVATLNNGEICDIAAFQPEDHQNPQAAAEKYLADLVAKINAENLP